MDLVLGLSSDGYKEHDVIIYVNLEDDPFTNFT